MSRLKRAVFIFEEDAALPEGVKPLMLEAVLSCPILTWVGNQLRADGVQRFFAVCGPRFAEEARTLLPPDAAVSEQWGDLAPELAGRWRERMTNNVQGAELVSGWLPVYGPDTVAEIEALLLRRGVSAPAGNGRA